MKPHLLHESLKRVDVESERKVLYPRRVWVGPAGRTHVTRAPAVVSRDQDKIEKDGDQAIVFFTRTDDIDGFDFKVDELSAISHRLSATSIDIR